MRAMRSRLQPYGDRDFRLVARACCCYDEDMQVHRIPSLLAAMIAVGCGSTSTPQTSMSTSTNADALSAVVIGVWERVHPHGERERLTLFGSNVMALERYGELPISHTVARWYPRNGELEVSIASCEGNCADTPTLPSKLAVRRAADTLHLTAGTVETTWTRLPDPYGTSPGAKERETRDEISWTYRLGIAEGKAQSCRKTTASAETDVAPARSP
jgi:hypothetical protein